MLRVDRGRKWCPHHRGFAPNTAMDTRIARQIELTVPGYRSSHDFFMRYLPVAWLLIGGVAAAWGFVAHGDTTGRYETCLGAPFIRPT